MCRLSHAVVPSGLGKCELDVAVKLLCRCINIYSQLAFEIKEITLSNVEVGLIKSVEDLKNKKLRFPGKEGILPPDCNIEVLLEFQVCLPDLP